MTNKEAATILINYFKYFKPPIIRNDGKSVAHLLALEAIDLAIEALEAEPTKHGHNIANGQISHDHENKDARIFLCSECGYGFDDIYLANERDYPIDPNYCPNCGAKVDE